MGQDDQHNQADQTPIMAAPQDSTSRLRIWLARAAVSGALISIFIHLAIILLTQFITVSYSNADAGGGATGETIDFVIISEADSPEASEQLSITLPTSSELQSPSIEQLDPVDDLTTAADAIDPVGELEQGVDLPSGAAGAASEIAAGAGAAGAGAGASFFGLEAVGRRFCYIIDVSGSMRSGETKDTTRIAVVKRELTRSLLALIESSEFSVVLYAGNSGWLFGERQWLDSTQRNKLVAEARIASIVLEYDPRNGVGRFGVTTDGTKPKSAVEKAMALTPKPDAIYLLTDGQFRQSGVPEFIRNINRSALIPIHCLFISDGAETGSVESSLRTIANESGGSFRVINSNAP